MNNRFGRFVITILVVVLVAGVFIQHISADDEAPFKDIDTSYAKNEIIDLYHRNILTGTTATSFSPTKSITRAEFITVLDRLLKLDPAVSPVSPYTDVAKKLGITAGYRQLFSLSWLTAHRQLLSRQQKQLPGRKRLYGWPKL